MTGTLILALLVICAIGVPVCVVAGRAGTAEEEHSEETPHEGLDCRHCAALTVPPGLTGPVFIPRASGGGKS